MDKSISLDQSHGKFPNILLMGDFNFPDIQWKVGVLPAPASTNSILGRQMNSLFQLMKNHFLFQCVLQPTCLNNILDLVFSNNSSLISMIESSNQHKDV